MVNQIHDALIDLRNAVNRKKIPKNENLHKVNDIVEEILNFNKQLKEKGLKILNSKQMFQITDCTCASRQIIYYLYQAKEITKKVY